MKIVHVSPVVYLDRIRDSYDLGKTQAKNGHNVAVIGANAGKYTKLDINDRMTIYLLPSLDFSYPRKVTSSSIVLGLEDLLKRLSPDVIHIQTHLNFTAIRTLQIANKLGIPTITTIHGVTAKINPLIDAAQLAYLRTIGSMISKYSFKVVALTLQDQKTLVHLGWNSNKIIIIPNGVDTELFTRGKNSDPQLIAWHGRFVAQKGLEYLIQAASLIVKNGYPNIKFALVGEGPLKQNIALMAERLGVSKNIIFVGRLPSLKDIPVFLNQANFYVLPSLREGMPWALLEAMACGKPVIGSDISGINDVITHGKNGLIVPPRNSTALANSILLLLNNDKLRHDLGQNARQLMAEKYSWKIINERIEKIYSDTF